jgi:predicted nuclease of predicted toxin-antitoxin system
MNLFADACLQRRLVTALVDSGHTIEYARDTHPYDLDEQLLALALRQRQLLITDDLDFGELVLFRRLPTYGVVLLRCGEVSIEQKSQLLLDLLERNGDSLLQAFTVVTPERIRIRPLP